MARFCDLWSTSMFFLREREIERERERERERETERDLGVLLRLDCSQM